MTDELVYYYPISEVNVFYHPGHSIKYQNMQIQSSAMCCPVPCPVPCRQPQAEGAATNHDEGPTDTSPLPCRQPQAEGGVATNHAEGPTDSSESEICENGLGGRHSSSCTSVRVDCCSSNDVLGRLRPRYAFSRNFQLPAREGEEVLLKIRRGAKVKFQRDQFAGRFLPTCIYSGHDIQT